MEEESIEKESMKKEKKNKIPKVMRKPMMIGGTCILLVIVFIIGVKFSDSFIHRASSQELGFKDVGNLVTQSAYIRVLEDSLEDRKLFAKVKIPFTESRKIFSYMVQVDAAINFEEASIKDIDDKQKIIYIELPHAKIYNATPDPDSFISHLDSESLFTRIDSTEQNELYKDVVEKAKEDSISNGLLDRADENGKRVIESFIKTNKKYKDYVVECEYIKGE